MARPLRLEFEDAIYHLLARGNARQQVFASERDEPEFIRLLEASAKRFDVAVLAFVLMGNHFPSPGPDPPRQSKPVEVIRRVGHSFGVPESTLLARGGYGLEARNVAMALVWETCALSLREIGQIFGGIDYAAVAQRIRRVNQANPIGLRKARREMSNV